MRGLVYILIVLVITGCTGASSHHVRGLDEAEALMWSDPDAALDKLNAFDLSEFDDSAVIARWALLYSEAMVAKQLYAPNDTIVNIAIDYYERHSITEAFHHASELKSLLMSDHNNRDELATALYLQKEKEFMLFREKAGRERMVVTGLFVLMVAAFVIICLRQRLRLTENQYRTLMAEASVLHDDMIRNRYECQILADKLSVSLANRFNTIDELCDVYYGSQGTKSEQKIIVDKVKSQIDSVRNDDGAFGDMVQAVNECKSGLLHLVKTEWPEMKSDDYRLMVYLACRMSNRTIALLLNENIDVVYKRKSRLKARLQSLHLPHSDLFLSVF